MNIDAERIEERITPRTKAIVPVHYGGLPCRMERIWEIAARHGLDVVEDAAHTMGTRYAGRRIGSDPRSVFSVYSFHPNKNMTTIEGGAIAFHDARHAAYLKAPALPRHRAGRGDARTPRARPSTTCRCRDASRTSWTSRPPSASTS